MILAILLGLLAVFAAYSYIKSKRAHSYWRNLGVKQSNPKLIVGDSLQVDGSHSFSEMIQKLYNLHPDDRYSGVYQFTKPVLLIRDPDLLKQISVKDFDHFTDHVSFISEDAATIWVKNLFNLRGEKWRDMRAMLSPAFTGSKMKSMFTLMSKCAEQFTTYFEQESQPGYNMVKGYIEVELKDIYTRYTNDVIATCAFGVECDSLKVRDNEFYLMGKELTSFTGIKKRLVFFLMVLSTTVFKLFGWMFIDTRPEKFFTNLVTRAILYREENHIVRPDMIHLLMEARKGRLSYDTNEEVQDTGFAIVQESSIGTERDAEKREITMEDIAAQALIFFFAGFDSVATLLSFCSYELAINPDIQTRLRAEIRETLKANAGQITYEALNKMKYLDMVVSETLRLWPPGTNADRVCTKNYTIPSVRTDEVTIHLRKDDIVWLPYYAIHHDPRNYPNPERFDPERFSDVNKANIKPYTYFPFGSGPRNCIASRFALLETKTLLFYFLNSFELTIIDKTPIPLVLAKRGFLLNIEKGFWIGLKPLNI